MLKCFKVLSEKITLLGRPFRFAFSTIGFAFYLKTSESLKEGPVARPKTTRGNWETFKEKK